MRQSNYYGILGVSPDSTPNDIRTSYYSRARVIHPDRFDPISQRKEWEKANEMLAELNEAYSVLRNPTKRSEFDSEMGYRSSAASPPKENTRNTENQGRTETRQEDKHEAPKPSAATHEEKPDEEARSRRGPTYLRFGSLPSAIKEKLLDRQHGRGRHLAWKTKTLKVELGCLALAVGWIVAVFYLSSDYRWTSNQSIAYGAITVGSALLGWL